VELIPLNQDVHRWVFFRMVTIFFTSGAILEFCENKSAFLQLVSLTRQIATEIQSVNFVLYKSFLC